MTQLAKQEQLSNFKPFLKTSILWSLETTLIYKVTVLFWGYYYYIVLINDEN